MREKRRKIPLEVILDTPVSEARRKHGQQVYASRLCHRGQYEEAKEYCAKNNLNWPPFSGVPISAGGDAIKVSPPETATGAAPAGNDGDSPPAGSISDGDSFFKNDGNKEPMFAAADRSAKRSLDQLSDGAREAGPVVREEATPPELACGEKAPSETLADAPHGATGEPLTGVLNLIPPHETRAPALRKAKVWARCANKRLLKIKFLDGKEEYASMWNYRTGYRINDILEVELDKASGASGIWQERRKPV